MPGLTNKVQLLLIFFLLPIMQGKAQLAVPASPDSLYLIRSQQSGVELVRTNLQISRYHHSQQSDSLAYYLDILEKALEEDYDKRTDAFCHKFRGVLAYNVYDHDEALEQTKLSKELFTDLRDYKEMGWICDLLTRIYIVRGDLVNASENCHLALGYFERVQHRLGIADSYSNLGQINYRGGYQPLAQEYYNRALQMYIEDGDEYRTNKIYNNLGILYLEFENPKEALASFLKARAGFIKHEDHAKVAIVYSNIAICHEETGNLDSALFYTRMALNMSEELENIHGQIIGNINLGYYLRLHKDYDSSLVLFDKASTMAKEYGFKYLEEHIFKEYEDLYMDMEDFQKAYINRVIYDSLERDVLSSEAQQRIEELNYSFKNRMEEHELAQLRLERRNQTKVTHILLTTVFLFAVLLVVMINGFMQNRKQRQELSEKNKLLEEYNERLVSSEKELTELVEDKNKIFSIIAHDLRNPVAAVTGFAELLSENYNELDDPKRREYLLHILQGSERAMTLLENLLLWARSQMDVIEVKKEEVSVEELLRESAEAMISSFNQKRIELIIKVSDNYTLLADRDMLKAVIRNLLSNAMKFSYPDSKVELSAESNGNEYCIAVKDTGIGMAEEQRKSIFSSRAIRSSEGTNRESGSGLGLVISRDFTHKNGGIIAVESEHGKGSTFKICFPK
jgi:signal transduction histidine kinase